LTHQNKNKDLRQKVLGVGRSEENLRESASKERFRRSMTLRNALSNAQLTAEKLKSPKTMQSQLGMKSI
jgi:hypothetical protein